MKLVSNRVHHNCRCENSQGANPELMSGSLKSGKRLNSSTLLKTPQTSSGSIGCSSTIGKRGVGHSHASAQINIKASYLTLVNASPASSRGRCSPSLNCETTGLNRQSPTIIDGNYIRPTNRKFADWVGNYHSFIAKDYFGANQIHVKSDHDRKCNEKIYNFTCQGVLVSTRPEKKYTEKSTDTCLSQTGSGSKDLNVAHRLIISHLKPDSFSKNEIAEDSMKAVI